MKHGCAFLLLLALLAQAWFWVDDARVRGAKKKVRALVEVGQQLDEAERRLREAGFQLMYERPVSPTIDGDELVQIVIVGDPKPSALESFGYAAGLSWMPWTSGELPFVVIDATADGTITRIE